MSDLDRTCRICRGEATTSQPLLHPCKCRGSIRYIHQDCLLEWLKHSNKTTKKCDICNTPYKFKTIYDPSMPQRIPTTFLWQKLIQKTSSGAIRAMSILLYFVCVVIEIPLFWKFLARIYTWAIDGTLPQSNPTLINALLFGELNFLNYNLENLTPMALSIFKFRKFMEYTYFSGIRYVFVCVVVFLAIFVEHEWIVRDEGYNKMLVKRIGKEPRAKLVDMLQQALQGLRTDSAEGDENANENLQRLEMIARALHDIQEQPQLGQRGQLLRRAIDETNDQLRAENVHPEHNVQLEDTDSEGEQEDLIPPQDNADILNDNADDAALANDVFEIFGLNLNLSAPILVMGVCNAIIVLLLFLSYLIPHLFGILTFYLISSIVRAAETKAYYLTKASSYVQELSFVKTMVATADHYAKENEWVRVGFETFNSSIVVPLTNKFERLIILQEFSHPTLIERTTFLVVGYASIFFIICKFMNSMASGGKPLVGASRKVYKVLFEVTTTAKVFLIFAIEMFFFPVYCGWLLDICIAPLFLDSFKSSEGQMLNILFTSSQPVLQTHYIRLFIFWALGTLYMLFFALFVGMVRSKILRPGVLFFIRSPDDPNTRLIHDALVKPLSLQMSRIFLSAKVYTCFIILGIGGITWGIRLFLAYIYKVDNIMLPLKYTSANTILVAAVDAADIYFSKRTYTKFCLQYWKRVFDVSAHKLRLSHFILGRPVAQERGYVAYRNLFVKIKGTAQPDYSRPVTYRDAQIIFKEQNVDALFVPDGSYVRAPDNDTISRKFIKKMFVPVTKDDKLLREIEVNNPEEEFNSDSSDEEVVNDNTHTIVYRPPYFKLRCFGLVFFVWLFSAFLIISVIFSSLIIGKLLTEAISIKTFASTVLKSEAPILSHFNADLLSIFLGLKMELFLLKFWNIRKNKRLQIADETNAEPVEADQFADAAENNNALFMDLMPWVGGGTIFPLAVYSLSSFVWALWIVSVHKLCIDLVAKSYDGIIDPSEIYREQFTDFLLTKETIFFHFLAGFVTVVPFVTCFTVDLRIGNLNRLTWSECFKRSGLRDVLVNFIELHGSAVFIRMLATSFPNTFGVFNTIKVWAVLLAIFTAAKALVFLRQFYHSISDQVRNEKYVRGRAIINDNDD